MTTSATGVFREARDQVLSLRGDYERALEEFRWSEFEGPFNWDTDWFDTIAESNDRPALEKGGSVVLMPDPDDVRQLIRCTDHVVQCLSEGSHASLLPQAQREQGFRSWNWRDGMPA